MIFQRLFASICLVLMASYPVWAELQGHISNEKGMIGIRTDWDRKVVRVYYRSPAWMMGIRPGDKILEVDGNKKNEIVGEPYTTVDLLWNHQGQIMHYKIERLPESVIRNQHDEYLRNN